jgi:YD repeat-containing protein
MPKILSVSFAVVFSVYPSFAETGNTAAPSDKLIVSPGGVDMRTGRFVYRSVDATIGGMEEFEGLSIIRSDAPSITGVRIASAFSDHAFNWDIKISESLIRLVRIYPDSPEFNQPADYQHLPNRTNPDYRMQVHFGSRSDTFDSLTPIGPLQGTLYNVSENAYARLDYTGLRTGPTVYKYTATDGTIVNFRPLANECSTWQRCAYASSVIAPDGTTVDLSYVTLTSSGVPTTKLSMVTSNRGFASKLFYNLGTDGVQRISGVCTFNMVNVVNITNFPCSGSSALNSSYVYDGSGRLNFITQADGRVESIYYSGATVSYSRPGANSPYVTNTLLGAEIVTSQVFADGSKYSYVYTPVKYDNDFRVAGGYYLDSGNNKTTITFGQPLVPRYPPPRGTPPSRYPAPNQLTPGPIAIVDSLNRTTTMDYCDPATSALPLGNGGGCLVSMLQSYINPDGDKTVLTYNLASKNVVHARTIAKPGSGLPDIVTSATFDCSNLKSCAKPTSVTDAKGQVTAYTYDTNHGGVLTETMPAVGGVAPQKRYEYAQRYAWVKNSSGGYVQGATPVWVKTKERFCKTTSASGASCAGGAADEVVTDYDYGPDSGPNNLQVRGVVVTATNSSGVLEALRTCFGYDVNGRKISETKPGANLGSCS